MMGSDILFLLRIRFLRILEMIVWSGTLIWLFSPAWEAIKLTLVHLQPGSTYPQRRISAFLPIVIKLACLEQENKGTIQTSGYPFLF